MPYPTAGHQPDIINLDRIVHIPEPVYGPCPVCGAETSVKCPPDCPGAPPEPHDKGRICNRYDTNPPADRRPPTAGALPGVARRPNRL